VYLILADSDANDEAAKAINLLDKERRGETTVLQ
jgi:hypothetical protein